MPRGRAYNPGIYTNTLGAIMEEGFLISAVIIGLIEIGIVIEYGWTGVFVTACLAILAELFLSRFDLGGFVIFGAVAGTLVAAALYVIFKIIFGLVHWRMSIKESDASTARALDEFEHALAADPVGASSRIKSAIGGTTSAEDYRQISFILAEFKRQRPDKFRKARGEGIL